MKHTTQYVIPLTSIIFVIFVNRYNIIPLSPFFIRSSVYFPFAGCRSSQKKEKEKEKETSEPVHLWNQHVAVTALWLLVKVS